MGINREDLIDLIETTLEYMPKASLSLLLSALSGCETDEEIKYMVGLISKWYTPEEVLAELKKQYGGVSKFFGKVG